MGIIAWILLGLFAGLIARALVPGKNPDGVIVTIFLGIAGALVGGFIAGALFDADPIDEFFDISTWVTAVAGAVLLIWIYKAVTGSRRRGILR